MKLLFIVNADFLQFVNVRFLDLKKLLFKLTSQF